MTYRTKLRLLRIALCSVFCALSYLMGAWMEQRDVALIEQSCAVECAARIQPYVTVTLREQEVCL